MVLQWGDEDEVIAADMAHEPVESQQTPDHVVQDPGQEMNDPISVIIGISVVELLEVIQVGITDGELAAALEPATDLALDLGGARHSGRRMDSHVAIGAGPQCIKASPLLRRREER